MPEPESPPPPGDVEDNVPSERDFALGDEFETPSRDEWRELVAAVLAKSGRSSSGEHDIDPEDALSFETYDGITIRPLYTADDVHGVDEDGLPGQAPFIRGDAGTRDAWDVRARHADPDAERTKLAILDDLERGATSLWLTLGAGGIAVQDLPTVLDGVLLDLAPIVLDAGAESEAALAALLELAAAKDIAPTALTGSCGADPIGSRARTGADADLGLLGRLVEQRGDAPLTIATVDGTVFHDAGAADAQELGIAAAVGVAYLRELVDPSTGPALSVDDALDAVEFRFAVTAEQFPSIAKLRAARRVWDRVAELCGASDDRAGQRQHAVTSAAMLTRRDPWVNLLRATVACFGAAVGGADAITVAPFDAAIGLPDDFARRIARNTHAVLHDESSLARVTDAAGGSWFVESLTDELAAAAWTVFTDIEKRGGVLAGLDDGSIDALLAATREKRAGDVAHRRTPITGVSEFAFVDEKPVSRQPAPSLPDGLLPRMRYAQDFEALRDAAEAGDGRPAVFLAALGPPAVHSARLGFATNLFAAGGIEPVVGIAADPADGTDELVTAFRESGTSVACLCSTDKLYADAAPVVTALRDAGAKLIWIAGKLEVEGIDGQLFAGCDALEALHTTFDALGVAR